MTRIPTPAVKPVLLVETATDAALSLALPMGEVVLFTRPKPSRVDANQDGLLVLPIDDRLVLAVADGAGGMPQPAEAVRLALGALEESVRESTERGLELRHGILNGFELANERVRGLPSAAATTLSVVGLVDGQARCYHVGDSTVFVTGQRGRIRFRSMEHSPVGLGVAAGLIDQEDEMEHEERHLVTNFVGTAEMRIDVGPRFELAARDTVVLGSDGLFDNLELETIVEAIRKGPLRAGVERLAERAIGAMESPQEGQPSKPDDLTIVAFRTRTAIRRASREGSRSRRARA